MINQDEVIVGVLFDFDNHKVEAYYNNVKASEIPITEYDADGQYKIVMGNSHMGATSDRNGAQIITVNFDPTKFMYTMPIGAKLVEPYFE